MRDMRCESMRKQAEMKLSHERGLLIIKKGTVLF